MSTKTATDQDVQQLIVAINAANEFAGAMPQAAPTKTGTLALVAAHQRIHNAETDPKARARKTWILDGVKFTGPVRGAVAASDTPDVLAEAILRHALTEAGADA